MDLDLDWRTQRSQVWPEVSYQIRPLKVWAFQELMDGGEMPPPPEDGGPGAPAPGRNLRMMEAARRIFPEHVRNVEGLTLHRDGHPEAATPQALCEETALLPLAGEVLARLVSISEVTEVQEKN